MVILVNLAQDIGLCFKKKSYKKRTLSGTVQQQQPSGKTVLLQELFTPESSCKGGHVPGTLPSSVHSQNLNTYKLQTLTLLHNNQFAPFLLLNLIQCAVCMMNFIIWTFWIFWKYG